MSSIPATAAENPQDTPSPRRRRRAWRWVLIPLLVLLAMAAGAWFVWGLVGQAKLDRLADEIRGRGEPLDWKDFATPPVPDDQNAVPLYLQAAERLFQPTPEHPQAAVDRLRDMEDPLMRNRRFRQEHRDDWRVVMELSRESLSLVRQAAVRAGADWKIDYSRPAFWGKEPPLHNMMRLNRITVLAAIQAHESGDDADALGRIHEALVLAGRVGQIPSVRGQQVAWVAGRDVCAGIEAVVPTLRVGGVPAASAEQIRELIGELADPGAVSKGWVRAAMAERARMSTGYRQTRRGVDPIPPDSPLKRPAYPTPLWVKAPLLTWQELGCLRACTSMVEGAKERWHGAAMRRLTENPGSYEEIVSRKGIWSLRAHHAPEDFFLRNRNLYHPLVAIAQRRMAAAALAMRLYEVEKGKAAGSLSHLVAGGELKNVPADPFSEKVGRILYKADPKQPLLYSVGFDGQDDGGHAKKDLVFYLKGDRPDEKVTWKDAKGEKK